MVCLSTILIVFPSCWWLAQEKHPQQQPLSSSSEWNGLNWIGDMRMRREDAKPSAMWQNYCFHNINIRINTLIRWKNTKWFFNCDFKHPAYSVSYFRPNPKSQLTAARQNSPFQLRFWVMRKCTSERSEWMNCAMGWEYKWEWDDEVKEIWWITVWLQCWFNYEFQCRVLSDWLRMNERNHGKGVVFLKFLNLFYLNIKLITNIQLNFCSFQKWNYRIPMVRGIEEAKQESGLTLRWKNMTQKWLISLIERMGMCLLDVIYDRSLHSTHFKFK